MINDDCRTCSQIEECNGFDIPCMARPQADYTGAKKIARFALIVFLLSLPLVAYLAIKHYNHNHTYQQVKK